MTEAPLVGVVIPACNAAATLDETLTSVRAQTHRALEIIVVDDGSTDATRAIAERHATEDPRVRVLHQANAGVAAARNAGWRQSRAEFVAFVDADDLWAPPKIERQLAALQAAGPRAGLAYCWSSRIDADGIVISEMHGVRHQGDVRDSILRSNFVGSGSAAMLRRSALEQAGGFDSSLRACGGEGCEDWLLYARVAMRWGYAVVPERLVGYRATPHAMSTDRVRMLRSHALMCERLRTEHPEHAQALRRGLRNYARWLFGDWQVREGTSNALRLLTALRSEPQALAWLLLRDLPYDTLWQAGQALRRALRHRLGRPKPRAAAALGRRFLPSSARGPSIDRE